MYLGVLAILIESAAPIAISGVGLAVARLFVRDGGTNWEANQALGVFQILSNIASVSRTRTREAPLTYNPFIAPLPPVDPLPCRYRVLVG